MAVTPKLDTFTRGYLECALWTSDLEDYGESDIDPTSLARAIEVCEDFQRANAADLSEASVLFHKDASQHGHDFWLARNGHGCGLWDRGYGELGARLTRACKPYGEANVFGPEMGDNGASSDEQIAAWDGVIYIED